MYLVHHICLKRFINIINIVTDKIPKNHYVPLKKKQQHIFKSAETLIKFRILNLISSKYKVLNTK